MRSLLFFLTCFFLIGQTSAQIAITGVVVDGLENPIQGVSVFFNNTSYVTVTDSVGVFLLEGRTADYQLIAYMKGFEIEYRDVNRSGTMNLELSSIKEIEDDTVTVGSTATYSELEREEFLLTFRIDFLGRSRNAENCEILNPEVIKFELSAEGGPPSLRASASEPILIRNKRLGYDLSYHLQYYERTRRVSSYLGYVSFENTPGLELKPKYFEAREKAYRGSSIHFLKSVLAGKHNREGYRLQTATQVGDGWLWKEMPVSNLAVYNDEGVFLFGAGKFRIVYLAERREFNYVRWLKANGIKEVGRGQFTEMEFVTQKVKILPSGTLDPPLGLVFRGYMGWEQVGDALPMNYRP